MDIYTTMSLLIHEIKYLTIYILKNYLVITDKFLCGGFAYLLLILFQGVW